MKFEEVLSVFETFFKDDGIPDESFTNDKNKMMQAVRVLHALLLQGLSPAERNEIRCLQEINVPEDCPERRSLQQLHFFLKELRLEKAVWSNVFRFINFPLQSILVLVSIWKTKFVSPKNINPHSNFLKLC